MCQLKELTFSCGHTQLSLLEANCPSAFRTKNSLTASPPEFCRAGISIATRLTSPKACKENCRRHEALSALSKKYEEANGKIEKMAERVEAVRKCAERGLPKLDFRRLKERGWDATILDNLCKASLEDVRRLLISFACTKTDLQDELNATYTVAKSSVCAYNLTSLLSATTEIVYFDGSPLEEFGEATYAQLYDLVCEIERRASEACLDRWGWVVPEEDQVQKQVLWERAGWKRGVTSGTRMDDSYLGKRTDEELEYMGVASS